MSPTKSSNIAKARAARRRRGPISVKTPLTPKEHRFVLEYLRDGNGAAAARAAGYAEKSARVTASQLLAKPNVWARYEKEREARDAQTRVDAVNVIRKAAALYFEPLPNMKDLEDAHGNLKRLGDMTRAEAAGLQSFEVVKRNLTSGDGKTDLVLKVRVLNLRQVQANLAELLFRHLGLLKEPIDERPRVPAFALPEGTTGVDVV